jgi:hypothetical protein
MVQYMLQYCTVGIFRVFIKEGKHEKKRKKEEAKERKQRRREEELMQFIHQSCNIRAQPIGAPENFLH